MAEFVTVARAHEVPPGARRRVHVAGRNVALFNLGGTFHAIDDTCPHRGGSLGLGDLAGPVVECPLHGWRFDVRTGVMPANPAVAVRCYAVRVVGDEVQVEA